MMPDLSAMPWQWHWRPDVAFVLVTMVAVYAGGWYRLRRQGAATGWQLALYLGGIGSLVLALLSPLDLLADRLFTAHMVQHQLLLMVAPPLLLLGNPVPPALWGLPPPLRRRVGRTLGRRGAGRRALRILTRLPVAGFLYTVTLWVWHHPALYQAALASPWVHDLEHLTFVGTALLFWWPVVNPAPHWQGARTGLYYGLRIGYLILITAQNTLLGALLGLTERVLYPWYATASPRLFGLEPLDDQALGGGVMWSGSHMYLVAVLLLVGYAMDAEGRSARSRGSDRSGRETDQTPPPGGDPALVDRAEPGTAS